VPLKSCLVCGTQGHWQGSRCPRHQLKAWQGTAQDKAYLSSSAWRHMRGRVLTEEPICRVRGCYQPSVTADHILNRRRGGTHDRSNLQGLCKAHHAAKTAKEAAIGRRRA
jgi:5-methylcytosine-specific restriction endonuclease McrA